MKSSAKNLELINLSKTFITSTRGEVKAVQQVNLKIEQGEFVTLLGPSGCGKTTLLRMIAGFELPTAGQILIGGNDVSSKTPDKRDIGMVFQNYALFPHLNVFNNIAYGLKLQKLPKEEIDERVKQALKTVQMDDFALRVPSQMSGGQQQRVALARALVMEPTVLLFDEPLSNLDAKLRIHMRDEIRRIQKEIGITTVYVTHDQAEAMAMSDKIVILKEGFVQQVDTPQKIYQRPQNAFISNFIGKANILPGTVVSCENNRAEVDIEGVIFSVPETVDYTPGKKVDIVIRPESVLVGEKGFTATVTKSVYMGSTQDYSVEVNTHKVDIADNNPTAKRVYKEGEQMEFSLDPDSIHIL